MPTEDLFPWLAATSYNGTIVLGSFGEYRRVHDAANAEMAK